MGLPKRFPLSNYMAKRPPRTKTCLRGPRNQRPRKWANPIPVGETFSRETALRAYEAWVVLLPVEELAGFEWLACTCKPGEACHTEVLIAEMARRRHWMLIDPDCVKASVGEGE